MKDICMGATEWFWGLGNQYGVNPIVFGSIYVGAMPLFTLLIAWLIKSKRDRKSLFLANDFLWILVHLIYLYLFIAGTNVPNIPWWVYSLALGLVAYAATATFRKVRAKLEKI